MAAAAEAVPRVPLRGHPLRQAAPPAPCMYTRPAERACGPAPCRGRRGRGAAGGRARLTVRALAKKGISMRLAM